MAARSYSVTRIDAGGNYHAVSANTEDRLSFDDAKQIAEADLRFAFGDSAQFSSEWVLTRSDNSRGCRRQPSLDAPPPPPSCCQKRANTYRLLA